MGNVEADLLNSGWCVGAGRKDENEENNNRFSVPASAGKTSTSLQKELNQPIVIEGEESVGGGKKKNSSSAAMTNPQTALEAQPMIAKKSTAELLEIIGADGVRSKYANTATLDDAMMQGLISVEDYAHKLKQMDSFLNGSDNKTRGTSESISSDQDSSEEY